MTLNIFDTREEALTMLAKYFVQIANEAIEDQGRFSVALSGGHTPAELYGLLATEAYSSKISDWSKLYFFFGDERYGPQTHTDSNYRMAKTTLLDPLQIPVTNIFSVNTSLSPEAAAADYQQRLDDFFISSEIRFDLILLGLGDNVHTASLFPNTSVLHDEKPGVKAVWVAALDAWRITLNAPMINHAKHIAFLVFGKEKAIALQHTFSEQVNTDLYPAQLIRKKRIAWFTDTEATSLLSQK